MMDNQNNAFLSVENLAVEYTSNGEVVHAVNGVSFTLERGKTLGLVGETGAGKTTIAKSILRILPEPPARITGGRIVLDGVDLLELEQNDLEKMPEVLKKYLQARILRLRGLAHWRQNQLALAEKDLSKAVSLLKETGLPLSSRGELFLDLGALRQVRRDMTGMCSAYREACALGLCAALAASRRQGLCPESLSAG